MNSKTVNDPALTDKQMPLQKGINQGRIVSIPEEGQCLDPFQLDHLERSFREWAEGSGRADVRLARRRILIIFLLVRYTGVKLNEVLALNPFEDIDFNDRTVLFRREDPPEKNVSRKVQISDALALEIQEALSDPLFRESLKNRFDVDPGFVRRKFYERAEACGFPKKISGPEMVRKARAVELMLGNMPLPAVQKMLGHSTLNLTASHISFSAEDIQQVTRLFIDRESLRKTSARNSFFGKIQAIRKGSIQSLVTLTTVSGCQVTSVITNNSLEQLALKKGQVVSAEVKAPWIILYSGKEEPRVSAENRFNGVIECVSIGRVNTEYTVRLPDGTALCAVVATESANRLCLTPGDPVWAVFNCYSIVLHVD